MIHFAVGPFTTVFKNVKYRKCLTQALKKRKRKRDSPKVFLWKQILGGKNTFRMCVVEGRGDVNQGKTCQATFFCHVRIICHHFVSVCVCGGGVLYAGKALI